MWGQAVASWPIVLPAVVVVVSLMLVEHSGANISEAILLLFVLELVMVWGLGGDISRAQVWSINWSPCVKLSR